MSLIINEIYYSIQGESSLAGKPCVFIRLTYCNLRCSYCDTEHAFYNGKEMNIKDIIKKIKQWPCKLIEVTGGEPLLQRECITLLNELIKLKYKVMLETSGSLPLNKVPSEVIKIIDFKCPSSKMKHKNSWKIINDILPHDEIKFVIGNKEDYDWAKEKIYELNLNEICTILFSPVFNSIEPKKIIEWILTDNIPVRFQLQMHKIIWEPDKLGV
jgi:7-carboxy-7-deazaguanine synthase